MHATSNVDFAFCSLLLSMRKVPLTLPSLNLGLNLFFHTRHSVLGVFLLWSLRSTGGGGLEVLDVWSWISTVCCSPLKGSWDRFACCLVVVKKGSYWFLMFSLIAKLRTYCECDHITIMTPCSAKVLLYLKTRNLVTLWFQFADRVVWWVEEFFHSIFLCGAVAFLTLAAHFLFLTLTFTFVTRGGLSGKQKLSFCRCFPCCSDAIALAALLVVLWRVFPREKLRSFFPSHNFCQFCSFSL